MFILPDKESKNMLTPKSKQKGRQCDKEKDCGHGGQKVEQDKGGDNKGRADNHKESNPDRQKK